MSTTSLPKTFKAAIAETADSPLVIKQVPLRMPSEREILVKVLACGVCGSDTHLKAGRFGTHIFPRILGHEIIGDIVATGSAVTRFHNGDRVGGPWHGGHDAECRACARGQFQFCDTEAVNGLSRDGGFAEYVLLREEAVVSVPRNVDPVTTAPLLCAGLTVFNGLRKLGVEQGNLVAVQGVGGLGHLAVQFARRMGYRVVALSRGDSKRDFALQLGAHAHVDTSAENAAEALAAMGGAAAIVVTGPSPKAMSDLVGGLQAGGKLLVLPPIGPVEFDTGALITKGLAIHGWASGHALDAEETIGFANDQGVECIVQGFKLDDVNKAIAVVENGSVRFRAVLVME
jgi:D-arabinose 1-dehydrogenase-like Zn-dependent alcohol dehydrogenase